MASDGLAACMRGSAVTLLLFLFVMLMWVESEPVGTNRLVPRRIPGVEPLSIDELSFASVKKEADKHVETFVESGEFVVGVDSGPNGTRFFIATKTDAPPSTAGGQQKQLQQSTQQPPQVKLPPEQQPQVQKQQQLQQSQQQGPLKQQPQVPQQQNQPPEHKKQQPPYQRRRHHRKARQNDAMEETLQREAIVTADDSSLVVRKQRDAEGKSRQLSASDGFDKYFRKKSIDDYFRKASDEEDRMTLREKR